MIERRKKPRNDKRRRKCKDCLDTGLLQTNDIPMPIMGGEMGIEISYCPCGAGLFNPFNKDKCLK